MLKRVQLIVAMMLVASLLAVAFGSCNIAGGYGSDKTLGTVTEAWNIIFSDYVERERLDPQALRQAAIKAMLEELDDPYTSYLDPESYKLSLTSLQGEFQGIGAQVAISDGRITIIAPIAGSPAAQAGIKAGDVILEIDGVSTDNMSLPVAVGKIRGTAGTKVRLLIRHQGQEQPEVIEIVRADIELKSVESEMREEFAYIKIGHFTGRTDDELRPVLEGLGGQGAKGIILDLRSNPGGVLSEVIDVVSHFLKEGVVVFVVDNNQNRTAHDVRTGVVTTDLPMVILTDNFSASGSEVLAGALQDHKRAVVAGAKTFGKGSVNVLRQLSDGAGLYITTARWLTPDGRLIEGKGIEPDYPLDLEGEDAVKWAIDYLRKQQPARASPGMPLPVVAGA